MVEITEISINQQIIGFNHSHTHANDSNSPKLQNYGNTTICNYLEHTELDIYLCHTGRTSRAAGQESPHDKDAFDADSRLDLLLHDECR